MEFSDGELRVITKELYDADNDRLREDMLRPDLFLFHDRAPRRSDHDRASRLTLLLTTECNAGCLYCFADPQGRGKAMSFETAKIAIDKAFAKVRQSTKKIDIVFFGAGEPTLVIGTIEKINDYLSVNYSGRYTTFLMTNGLFNDTVAKSLLKIDDLCVSCDGPGEFQDKTRPFAGGHSSSVIVEGNIRFLSGKKRISIKSTVVPETVDRQDEIIEYAYRLGVNSVGISPFALRERGERNNLEAIDYEVFVRGLLRARELADLFGMRMSTEYLPLHRKYSACGFDGPSVAVTPDGHLSSCWESCEVGKGADFIYGKLGPAGEIIYEDIFKKITSRSVENIPDCQSCFLKWSCAGGCAANHFKITGDLLETDNRQCEAVRQSTRDYLLHTARKFAGRWSPEITKKSDGAYLTLYFSEYKLGRRGKWEDNPLIVMNAETSADELKKNMLTYRDARGYKPTFFVLETDENEGVDYASVLSFASELSSEKAHLFFADSDGKVIYLK